MDTETTHQQRRDGRLTIAALGNEPVLRPAAAPILPLSRLAGDQERRRRRTALRLAMQALA